MKPASSQSPSMTCCAMSGAAALPRDVGRRFDIGGPDVLTYAEMMRRYSEVAGLRPRVLVPVPLLTPRLSSLWVGLVTPVPSGLARPLVESLRNEVVCAEHDIASYVPDPPEGLLPVDHAIALGPAAHPRGRGLHPLVIGGHAGRSQRPAAQRPVVGGRLAVRGRAHQCRPRSPAALWRVIEGIGGETGWYSFPPAWAVRGLLDRLAGGVGLRRGRRDPAPARRGRAGFLAGRGHHAGSLLRLRAEMKLPGLAWLELSVGRDA